MIQTGQIIYFSNQKLMCFGVESIEDITDPADQIETTSAFDDMRTYIPAIMKPTTLVVTGEEMVNLIVQTMEIISEKIMETSIIKIITMETIITEDH